MALPSISCIDLESIAIHQFTTESLHDTIGEICASDEKAIIANVNVNAMNLAYDRSRFKKFLQDADYVFCDGFGVKWGAQILSLNIPERITFADWVPQLAEYCEEHGLSIYFLGAKEGVAQRAVDNLLKLYPNLKVAGIRHGYFNQSQGHTENHEVIEVINRAKPHVLLTSFGMPMQEWWLEENWGDLQCNVALCGGAALDYVAGEVRRAPSWMTDNGFEWLGRLFIEPSRLWRRYLVGNPRFLGRIMRAWLKSSRVR